MRNNQLQGGEFRAAVRLLTLGGDLMAQQERAIDFWRGCAREQMKKNHVLHRKVDSWQGLAPPLPKDTPMPMTEPYFRKTLAMHAELIDEQRAEIATLKSKVNRLEQKLQKYKGGLV